MRKHGGFSRSFSNYSTLPSRFGFEGIDLLLSHPPSDIEDFQRLLARLEITDPTGTKAARLHYVFRHVDTLLKEFPRFANYSLLNANLAQMDQFSDEELLKIARYCIGEKAGYNLLEEEAHGGGEASCIPF